MNPNIPYGQMPMQPPQRRHDMPYAQIPHHHMRPYPAHQQYYPQPMAPMMPQYQHYPPNWYPYQHHMPPHPANRPAYYPQHPPPYPPHQIQQQSQHQQQSPLIVSSQLQPQSSPRHVPPPSAYPATVHPSTDLVEARAQTQSPRSRRTSTVATGAKALKEHTPPTTPASKTPQAVVKSTDQFVTREPFSPPIPWLSVADQPFPPRRPRRRRTVLRSSLATIPTTFPLSEDELGSEVFVQSLEPVTIDKIQQEISIPTPNQTPTPLPSTAASDSVSTQPTTPSSTVHTTQSQSQITPTQSKVIKAAVPIVPVVPHIPTSPSMNRSYGNINSTVSNNIEVLNTTGDRIAELNVESSEQPVEIEANAVISPPPAPTSWAALLRNKTSMGPAASSSNTALVVANGLGLGKGETLRDILGEIKISEEPSKLSFLQPRGLVNTGNMCYMNSILQVLVFCIPFYEFLDSVAKRAPHNFKSDTPLVDAMIMFMKEFSIIDSTTSLEQLRLRLKPEDYERYGDPFIPEYVYNVIKQLPRFRDMRRGHQQDAQEFLGFLLEELHEECALVMRSGTAASSGRSTPINDTLATDEGASNESGWMEVGHKQKAAVTRSSGAIATESPVTNIFGGKLRSELKVSGNKLSVTLEPYQPLQLDIGSPQVSNILDALKGLTRPESMQGDFQSARGPKTSATKQVFIDTLPPVLILHLKRFHYDAGTKRVEKIWKKVGYPLEFEMPKEVFPTSARNRYAAHGGLPKYRLISVIYHHGRNASGGHYTVDIRRQDGREWIRMDDTFIRRIRSEDVAEGGSEEDPKILAAALEQHKQEKSANNRFEQIDDGEEKGEPEKVWNQVNGHSRSKSTMSAIVNGSATPATNASGQQTPRDRFSMKDNKVAYLLFYQRISN